MAKYIIAHDVGTTNNKAVLVGVGGEVHGKVLHPYDIKYPRPGWAEQDPEDWWSAVTSTTKQLLSETGVSPADILCLTFSTQMLGIVPMDEKGVALRQGIIWMDNRAAEEAKFMMNNGNGYSRL